jgi:ankyrin repeat protein
VPTHALPDRPSLEQLRTRARDLKRAAATGDPAALSLFAEHHPDGVAAGPTLTAAQLVVARQHGFASWAKLKRHIETVVRLSREPDQVEPIDDPADELLRLACLTYGDADHPDRWARARALLAADPGLTGRSIHVAAAAADAAAVREHVDRGVDANTEGGPFRWPPLLYLAYARHDPGVTEDAVVSTARALVGAGADPDAGFLWHGFPSPFTALTGAFGEGEQGPERQPRHTQSIPLARTLLEAGADPNDAQALYNRIFGADDDHLVLLLEHGLGRGDGPWRRRLGDALDPPAALLRGQLHWAITHGLVARVRLLADHGVDVSAPFTDLRQVYWHDTRTPLQLAELNSRPEIAACLREHGAEPSPLSPGDAMVAALLAADRPRLEVIEAGRPGLLDEVRRARRGLIVWATASGLRDAVALMLELSFDVNALGRGDVPIEEPWQTALHEAAHRGDAEMARLLIAAGADPDIRDARFDAPPLGWAEHAGQQALADLLRPLTAQPQGRE